MTAIELEKLRYPIGKFVRPQAYSAAVLKRYIQVISAFPSKLRKETASLLSVVCRADGGAGLRTDEWTGSLRLPLSLLYHIECGHIIPHNAFLLSRPWIADSEVI